MVRHREYQGPYLLLRTGDYLCLADAQASEVATWESIMVIREQQSEAGASIGSWRL